LKGVNDSHPCPLSSSEAVQMSIEHQVGVGC
jgi:hypothetical protein